MVKVIELITTLNTGGAESLVKDYCSFMDKDVVQLKVVVMSGRYNSLNEKIIDESGIEVVYLQDILFGDKEISNILMKIIVFISRYYFFRKTVLEYQPDIIHVHLRLGNYFKFLPLRRLGCKLILTVHNTPDRYFDRFGKNKGKYKEFKEAYRLVHKYGMKLIALHDSMNMELRQLFDTINVVTVSNGIDMPRFDKSLYDSRAVREKLGIPEDCFVIGNVGRFNIQKNHDKILDIFKIFHEKNRNSILLLIAGSGDLESVIREKIMQFGLNESVIILSRRSDIPELLSVMDVFLFPSRWEGYPIVLLEAQAMGLKCVISDKITKEVVLSDKVVSLPIDADDSIWIDALTTDVICDERYGDIRDYDMRKCIEKIQQIYLEEK